MSTERQMSKEKTIAAILEAAEEEFAGSGYSGARIRSIASRAGVSGGLVISYFETKDNLLCTILRKHSIAEMYEGVEETDPFRIFCIFMDGVRVLQRENPVRFTLMLRIVSDTDFPPSVYDTARESFEGSALESAIVKLQKDGDLAGGDAFSVFRVLACSVFIILNQYGVIGTDAPDNEAILHVLGYRREKKEYEAMIRKVTELDNVRRTLKMFLSLSGEYDPVLVIDPVSGEYDRLTGGAAGSVNGEAVSVHGGSIFSRLGAEGAAMIHEDERESFISLCTRQSLMRIAETGEPQEAEYRWWIPEKNCYRWKYAKAVRMTDEKGRVYVIVGVTDTTERKEREAQAEEQRRQLAGAVELANRQRYIKAFGDMLNAALWSMNVDEKDRVTGVFWSDELRRMLGFEGCEEDFPNVLEAWTDRIHPDDRERVLARFASSLKSRDIERIVYDIQYRIRKRSGEYCWHHTAGRMECNPDGTRKFYGIALDVSAGLHSIDAQRKGEIETQRQLEESLVFTNCFLDRYVSAYYVGLTDMSCQVYRRTEALESDYPIITSYLDSLDEYIAKDVHPDDRAMLTRMTRPENLRRALADRPEITCVLRDISGASEKTYRFQAIRGADPDHVAFGFMDITEQINERNLAGREAALADRRSAMLYEMTGSAPWSFTVEADNRTAAAHFPDALKRLAHYDLNLDPYSWTLQVHPDDRERAGRIFWSALFDPECRTPYDDVYRFKGDDGVYRWFRSTGRKTGLENGRSEFFGLVMDITERMEKERARQAELEKALAAADAANRAKTAFLLNMSHDIRTPMNAIIGFTDIARREIRNTQKALDCLEKVRLSSGVLLSLINDVLDMGCIESGRAELHEERRDITGVFEGLEPALAGIAASKDIDLKFSIGPVRDRYIMADGPRLDRVLVNIISNAIKYTPPGGFVRVSAVQTEDTEPGSRNYRFTVADSGAGMTEEFQKHMFEGFARGGSSPPGGIEGPGLGLPLAKRLIDIMGGEISCVSRLGIGTTFTLDFPFRLQTGEDVSEDGDNGTGTVNVDLKGKRALLVEDNELNRELAVEYLSAEGLSVDTAANGRTAVNMVREQGDGFYDFILMDIRMPVMDGCEAARAIHRLMPDLKTPIIALSANAFAEDRRKSIEAGMAAHLTKPIDMDTLRKTLSRFL